MSPLSWFTRLRAAYRTARSIMRGLTPTAVVDQDLEILEDRIYRVLNLPTYGLRLSVSIDRETGESTPHPVPFALKPDDKVDGWYRADQVREILEGGPPRWGMSEAGSRLRSVKD